MVWKTRSSLAQVARICSHPLRYDSLHFPLRRGSVPASTSRRIVPATVIYNIVDLNRFHPGVLPPADMRKGRKRSGLALSAPITPLKGHDIFLQAAESVLSQLPNAVFVIVGATPTSPRRALSMKSNCSKGP